MKRSRLYRYVYLLALGAGGALVASMLLPLIPGGPETGVGRLIDFAFIAMYSAAALFAAQALPRKEVRLTMRTGAFLILASGLLHMYELADTPQGARLLPWLGLRSALAVMGLLLMSPGLPRRTLPERILRMGALVAAIPLGAEAHWSAANSTAPAWVGPIRPAVIAAGLFLAGWNFQRRSRGRHVAQD